VTSKEGGAISLSPLLSFFLTLTTAIAPPSLPPSFLGMNRPTPSKAGPPPPTKTKKAAHCPGCMLPLGQEVRNIVAEAMVAKLRVRCSNSKRREGEEEGMREGGGDGGGEGPACEWVGRLEELERHRRSVCKFEIVVCPYHQQPQQPQQQQQQEQSPAQEEGEEQGAEGGKDGSSSSSSGARKGKHQQASSKKKTSTTTSSTTSSSETGGCSYRAWRSRIEKEHAPQCPHRPVSCSLVCGWAGKKMEEARHQGTSCPKVTLFCQNRGCSASFPRAGSGEHYDAHCPFQPVPCVFAPHGCLVRPLRQAQAKHQAEAAVEHASLTASKISSLEAGMEKMCGQFEDLRQR